MQTSPSPTTLFLLAPADVATNTTCLATIVQRVRRLGFWVGGVSPSSALQHRCAGRLGARVATDVFIRDFGLGRVQRDSCRLEAITDGLSLWRGVQLQVVPNLSHEKCLRVLSLLYCKLLEPVREVSQLISRCLFIVLFFICVFGIGVSASVLRRLFVTSYTCWTR